ncbi:AI-2E family transporter [Roseibium limicola]|uniref:AI-2E family transporter n=1 Tax=Roseibium limicola TaxID=2816037 RepID=A0A939JA90_9HYPH|nr:AI-2E family transporter [Roseibium limicola]MBO0346193.1 AI-2E family transporter [Roseibium limicola]
MTLRRQILFWLLSLTAVILFMAVFSNVLLPFVAGMAVAYLLDPVGDRLESWGMSRMWATVTILITFVIIVLLFLLLIVPVLGSQLAGFVEKLPDLVGQLQTLVHTNLGQRLSDMGLFQGGDLKSSVGNLLGQGASWLASIFKSLWSGGQALLSMVSLLVVTPVVAFYLLLDWDRMVERIDSWLPRDHQPTIRRLAREMDGAVSGFVRGQVSVCLLLGAFYAIGLVSVGLNFGLLIGMGAGLVSFIPFVGATLGFVISLGVALVQFWPDWGMIIAVGAIFGVGQFLEGNVLQPKLVGESTGLHPVVLMFALFAFGYLLGFVGMLIAVPVAAMLGVLARFALKQYLASPLYTGTGRTTAAPTETGN